MDTLEPPRGAARYLGERREPRTLLVNEIYASIQGEGPEQGFPCVLLRLTGCPLRCSYCDSAFAFFEGRRMAVEEAAEAAGRFGIPRVLVTGGEPLAQAATPLLCRVLQERGHRVSVETNGAHDLAALPPEVVKVVDVKTPGSGEGGSFRMENLRLLGPGDALKFVLTGREDFDFATEFLEGHGKGLSCPVFFSPASGRLEPALLAEWMVERAVEARLMVQLHKVLWGEARGR